MSIYTFKPTYLYVKQHSKTGLKYFGKTTSKNPIKYKGSGIYWKRHIKKHGKEFVKTIWFELFLEEKECKEYALNFSIENNIVESKEWANMMLEDGINGGSIGRVCTESTKLKISNANKGKKHSEEVNTKKARKGKDNGMYGVRRCGEHSPHYGKPHSKETKEIIREKAKGREIISCPHCNIESTKANASRWHFDNCKDNPNNKRQIKICPHCGVSGTNNMSRYHFDNCKKISII